AAGRGQDARGILRPRSVPGGEVELRAGGAGHDDGDEGNEFRELRHWDDGAYPPGGRGTPAAGGGGRSPPATGARDPRGGSPSPSPPGFVRRISRRWTGRTIRSPAMRAHLYEKE